MQPIDHVNGACNGNTNPQELIFPESPALRHGKRQLDDWVTELFPLDPLLSEDAVDTQHNEKHYEVKERPPGQWPDPCPEILWGIEAGLSLVIVHQDTFVRNSQPLWDILEKQRLPFVFHSGKMKGMPHRWSHSNELIMSSDCRSD